MLIWLFPLVFEWDPEKAKTNLVKHHVTFEEAQTAFFDPNALLIADPEHSLHEDRAILLGVSNRLRVLVICHCYREIDSAMRIISARKANRAEIKRYEEVISYEKKL